MLTVQLHGVQAQHTASRRNVLGHVLHPSAARPQMLAQGQPQVVQAHSMVPSRQPVNRNTRTHLLAGSGVTLLYTQSTSSPLTASTPMRLGACVAAPGCSCTPHHATCVRVIRGEREGTSSCYLTTSPATAALLLQQAARCNALHLPAPAIAVSSSRLQRQLYWSCQACGAHSCLLRCMQPCRSTCSLRHHP